MTHHDEGHGREEQAHENDRGSLLEEQEEKGYAADTGKREDALDEEVARV
jgi:hypothetical protein